MSVQSKKYLEELAEKEKKIKADTAIKNIERKEKQENFKKEFNLLQYKVIEPAIERELKDLNSKFTISTHSKPGEIYPIITRQMKYGFRVNTLEIIGDWDKQKVLVKMGNSKNNLRDISMEMGNYYNLDEINKLFVENLFFEFIKSVTEDVT